jgi:hypothetical protein
MFSEAEIVALYEQKVKKPSSYFTKYEQVPPCTIRAYGNSWNGRDFPRTWCILDFKEWMEKYNLRDIQHLGYTSMTDPELEFLQPKEKTYLPYPPYDLHTIGNHHQETFDFFLFSQTLEHLYNPFLAMQQIFKTVKKGGYVFTSVPTLNIPHMMPIHFNGFTPLGLALLFQSAGFDVVEVGQWGNYEYIQRLFGTHSWPSFTELQHDGKVTNEEKNVCQCWILARKPMST